MTENPVSFGRIETIIAAMKKTSIIVIGDSMIDEYYWGDVERISPEAPVPVVAVESVSRRLGGAANVVQNLSTLGVTSRLLSVCGNDDNGTILSRMLEDAGSSPESLYRSEKRPTTVKTRIIARHQQVVRADREKIGDLEENEITALRTLFDRLHTSADGVIISDYGKGVISPPLIAGLIEKCTDRKTFIAVDPKDRHIQLYKGVSLITPNLKEALTLAGYRGRSCSDEEVVDLGWNIIDNYSLSHLLITLSERGMALFSRENHEFNRLPTVAQRVFDVTGAGDTVISTFTAAIASGATPLEAAFCANHAAGITVAELGTASVTPERLLQSCR